MNNLEKYGIHIIIFVHLKEPLTIFMKKKILKTLLIYKKCL